MKESTLGAQHNVSDGDAVTLKCNMLYVQKCKKSYQILPGRCRGKRDRETERLGGEGQ